MVLSICFLPLFLEPLLHRKVEKSIEKRQSTLIYGYIPLIFQEKQFFFCPELTEIDSVV